MSDVRMCRLFGGGAKYFRVQYCMQQNIMATRSAVASRRKDSVSTKGGGGENFKVAVRVRPLIERELRSATPMVSEGGAH